MCITNANWTIVNHRHTNNIVHQLDFQELFKKMYFHSRQHLDKKQILLQHRDVHISALNLRDICGRWVWVSKQGSFVGKERVLTTTNL